MKQLALLLACSLLILSCKKTATSYNISLPNVSSSSITSVRETSAISGGDVVSTGNSSVTAKGVCWSTSHGPTIADDTTWNGSGIGIFVSSIRRLLPKTIYYVRAYAINNAGTAYGLEGSFTTASPPLSATGYYSGEIVSGTAFPHGTPIDVRLTNDSPVSGFIDVNAGTYSITGGSFNTPYLLVSSLTRYTIRHWVYNHYSYETDSTSLSLDGQLVDLTWSGTINFSGVNSGSGYFSCQRQ